VINKAAKNTYDLLNDILMWSKSHSGKLPFDPEILNLHEISGSVLGEKNSQADLKNISLNNLVPEDLVVTADKNMLNTVLRNLVSNAIKFTHRNGSVSIKADREENSVRLTVSDNGVGISSEDIGRLWDFAKPYTTEGTEKESGTGLGLVLCKEFVEKHGGKIKAESVLGKGTDLIFTLPLSVN
jgi:signal transduction histidine kinase